METLALYVLCVIVLPLLILNLFAWVWNTVETAIEGMFR